MPFETEFCDREPARVTVIQDGAFATVRMRRDIQRDVADGPDGSSCEFWRAETLGFRIMGTPTAEEIEADFDAIAERQLEAERTDAERIALLAQSDSDNADALAELGDMMAEQCDALAELGDMIATLQGGEQ